MSIDTTHIALAGEQQLQQMVGNPDPRVSIPAAARLAKIIQERKSQQNQQAMATPPQPTVKDQLQQAAMPTPQDTGIAMAAGGMVQRHFDDGGQADTSPFMQDVGSAWDNFLYKSTHNPESADDLAQQQASQAYREANRGPSGGEEIAAYLRNYFQKPTTVAVANAADTAAKAQVPYAEQPGADWNARAAAHNLRQGAGTGIAAALPSSPPAAAAPAAPVAAAQRPTANPPIPKSGLADAVTPATLAAGPVSAGKVSAAGSAGSAGSPDDTADDAHVAAAEELIDQLNPLQAQALAQLTASKSAEEARYKAAQEAKHDPNKFIDTMNRIVAITHPFAMANGNRSGLGNFGTLSEGAYNLAQTQQTQREHQAHEDAAHQAALAGIDSGMTQQQIKNLMGNYGITNTAMSNDDKQNLATSNAALHQSQFELNQAKLAEAQRLDNARIQKLTGDGGAGGAGKPMTEQQHQQYARQQAALEFTAAQRRIAAGSDEQLPDLAALAQKHYTLSKQFTSTPLQSGTPAPATGASPGWGQIQRH